MLEERFQLNAPACIAEAVEDDLIVINLHSGRYYNMRGETVFGWQALIQGVTPGELLSANTWDSGQTERFKGFVQYLIDEQLLVPQEARTCKVTAPYIELGGGTEPFLVDVFTDMEEMLLLDPIHDASVAAGWPHKA
jgi:hypothetical protein